MTEPTGHVPATGDILEIMKNTPRFVYVKGMDLIIENPKSYIIDKHEVERRVLCSDIDVMDKYILRILAGYSYADVSLISLSLKKVTAVRGDIELPINGEPNTIRLKLRKLFKLYLICIKRHVEITEHEGRKVPSAPMERSPSYYCITDYGLSYLKKNMDYHEQIEEQLTLLGQTDIFRRLACNYVGSYLNMYFHGMLTYAGMVYIKGKGRNLLYSRLSNQDFEVIIEPIFFKRDEQLLSEADNLKYLRHRLELIKSIAAIYSQESKKSVHLIFVCEGYAYLKPSINLVYDELNEDINISSVLFTSETAIKEYKGAPHSCLTYRKKDDSGQFSIKVCEKYAFYIQDEIKR